VLAVNKYGDGALQSTYVSIMTGEAPNAPSAPTTSVSSGSVYVDVAWSYPTDNNFAVDEYLIQIKKLDGTWYEDTTYCDGSDSTVISAMTCSIPMSILRSSPYNLVYGDSVVAQVKAHNSRGWSSYSASSTTVATIQTEPTQMSAPTRGSSTSSS